MAECRCSQSLHTATPRRRQTQTGQDAAACGEDGHCVCVSDFRACPGVSDRVHVFCRCCSGFRGGCREHEAAGMKMKYPSIGRVQLANEAVERATNVVAWTLIDKVCVPHVVGFVSLSTPVVFSPSPFSPDCKLFIQCLGVFVPSPPPGASPGAAAVSAHPLCAAAGLPHPRYTLSFFVFWGTYVFIVSFPPLGPPTTADPLSHSNGFTMADVEKEVLDAASEGRTDEVKELVARGECPHRPVQQVVQKCRVTVLRVLVCSSCVCGCQRRPWLDSHDFGRQQGPPGGGQSATWGR